MPYIDKLSRACIDTALKPLLELFAFDTISAGQLNYIITRVMMAHMDDPKTAPMPTYIEYNTAIGVLECAKLELYRRCIVPFEDAKCALNGDVYGD